MDQFQKWTKIQKMGIILLNGQVVVILFRLILSDVIKAGELVCDTLYLNPFAKFK